MAQIVECVTNFSEGRRQDVIDHISTTIADQNARVLDHHIDSDHNRTVITFIATPEHIINAAFAGIKTASELIDMDQHQGVHPRIGATDVVPFIPLEGVTMDECVQLARDLGQRVGDELNIPVYLYEYAAMRPDRRNLSDIRRGQYEGLKTSIATSDRQPDYGPSLLAKAGATAIGARKPLVAYNVYLTTDNVQVAKNIAKVIRHSSGGLRYVKALGLAVKGKAQVSMNLTDTTQTAIHQVFEMIQREAARYGTVIESSEIVGLVPQTTLLNAARWYLQIENLSSETLLETHIHRFQQVYNREIDT